MPAMGLSADELDAMTDYLLTLALRRSDVTTESHGLAQHRERAAALVDGSRAG